MANGIALDGSRAYVADWNRGLKVVDVSNPRLPVLQSSLELSGTTVNVAVSDNYAYLASYDKGVRIIDISNPSKPRLLGSYTTSSPAFGVTVQGALAFVTCRNGLEILNVADPATPLSISNYRFPVEEDTYWVKGPIVSGTRLYVSTRQSGVHVLDIADPAIPTLIANIPTDAANDLAEAGPTIIVADSYQLQALDKLNTDATPDVAEPLVVGRLNGLTTYRGKPFSETIPPSIFLDDDLSLSIAATLGDGSPLPQWLSFDPVTRTLSGTPTETGTLNVRLTATDSLGLASSDTLVLSVVMSQLGTLGSAKDVALSGGDAYVARGWSGLEVIECSDLETPRPLGWLSLPGESTRIAISGSKAYVLSASEGLSIIDISDPANPVLQATASLAGNGTGLAVRDGYAYVGADESLQVIDVRLPSSPKLVASIPSEMAYNAIAIKSNLAFVAAAWGGLQIFDLSTPELPVKVATINTTVNYVSIDGDRLCVGDTSNIQIFSLAQPFEPKQLGQFSFTRSTLSDAKIYGDLVYLASGESGVQILDISDPSRPFISEKINTPSQAIRITIGPDGQVVVIGQGGDVQVLPQIHTGSMISLASATVSQNEGSHGFTAFQFTVSRRGDTTMASTVAWSVSPDGSNAASSDDFADNIWPNGILEFAPGETSKTFSVSIATDDRDESDEGFLVTLSNPEGASLDATGISAKGLIVNDDFNAGIVEFSAATYAILENGRALQAVTLTRINGSEGEINVQIDLTDGTATAGSEVSDYDNSPIMVSLADGETSKIVEIPIFNDFTLEDDETIDLSLSNPAGGVALGARQNATLTIIDNDSPPNLVITDFEAPSTAITNENITLSWTVKNAGKGATTRDDEGWYGSNYSFWYDNLVFSRNTVYGDEDDVNLGHEWRYALPLESGDTYTVNKSIVLSGAGGNGYFLVKTDAYSYQRESNEEDNVFSQAVEITAPNLTIDNLLIPSTLARGQRFSLSWTVKNQSSIATTSSWYDQVVFSYDEVLGNDDDFYLFDAWSGEYSYLPLEENQSYSVNAEISFSNSIQRNKGYIFVKTDAFGNQGESNENDNTVSQYVEIASSNLLVSNLNGPKTAVVGQNISLSWKVENKSDIPSTQSYWYDRVVYSQDLVFGNNDDLYLAQYGSWEFVSNGLGARKSYTANRNITLPSSVTTNGYLLVKTDYYNYEIESDENDNVASAPLAIGGPNLTPTDLIAPSIASTGQTIGVSWTVQNQGTVASTTWWYDRLIFSTDEVYGNSDDVYLEDVYVPNHANLPLDPDKRYTVSRNIVLPSNIAGKGHLIVKTDITNSQAETNEENNIRSAAISINAPNLVISSPVEPPAAAVLGQSLSLSWRVVNSGSVSALAGWEDRVYLSDDGVFSNGDLYLGGFYRPTSLSPGASYTTTQSVFLPVTNIGSRYLLLVTDANKNQGETDESDNVIATPIRLTAPDLTITSATAPNNAVTSGTLNISWSVTNLSTEVAAADWIDEIRLSRNTVWGDSDDFGVTSGFVTIAAQSPLEPNQRYTIDRSITLPSVAAGNYNLLIRTDSYNQQGETDENNNIRALPITIAVPDLVVSAAVAPTNGISSQTIAVSWTVKNQGTVDAAADWYDSVYLSSNNTFESWSDFNITNQFISTQTPLSPESSYTVNRNITLPNRAAGDYFLLFITDDAYPYGNYQQETNENNNIFAVPITIGVPDLTVSAASAPSSGVLGGTIDVSWSVTNTSLVTAPADWSDRIYFSTDNVWSPASDTLITTESVVSQTPLPAGSSYTVNRSINLPNVSSHGDGYMLFVADANANQTESDETNNVRSIPFKLNAPNISVTAATAPSSVSVGSSFGVSWSVANLSDISANGDWYDSIYLSDDAVFSGGSDRFLGARWAGDNTPLLAVGSYTGTLNISIPSTTPGQRFLLFVSDDSYNYGNRQSETNEHDNVFALPINISSSDLVVSAAQAPIAAVVGNAIHLSWTVTNQGNGEAAQDWRDYVYLSSNQTIDGTDTLIINEAITSQTPLLPGDSYTIDKNINLSGIAPGIRYLIFSADGSGNQGELSESNNQRVVEISITAPDLVVSMASSPSTATTGSTIDVSWTTTNQGSSEASTDWADAVYLSADSLLDAADVLLSSESISSQTPLAPGANYSISRKIDLPRNHWGDRFLLFAADYQNVQAETDNSNNVKAVAISILATAVLSFDAPLYRLNEDGTAISAVTVVRSGITNEAVSVTLDLSSGTAIAGSDFLGTPIDLVFLPGETSKTVSIPIINDSRFEAEETINLVLRNPSTGAVIGTQNTALVTIISDDLPAYGRLAFSRSQFQVQEDGSDTVAVTIIRTDGSDGNVGAVIELANGTANAPGDYNNTPIVVSFAAGETSRRIVIPIVNDSSYEADETITLTLINPSGGANLGAQTTATLTIVDNDPPQQGILSFSQSSYSITENGSSSVPIEVMRHGGSDGEISVTVNLSAGSASAPADFDSSPILLKFGDGEISKTVLVPINDDSLIESTESFNLSLANATGGAIIRGGASARVDIVDNDSVFNFGRSTYSATENDATSAAVVITRTGATTSAAGVTVLLQNGTASSGQDFGDNPILVAFAPGETTKTISIPILDDARFEPTETFTLRLVNPSGGASIGTQGMATFTIVDNDAVAGIIQFNQATFAINENGIPVTAVTLNRTEGSQGAVSVQVNLTNGTATAGLDYTNSPITVSFADGETVKTVALPIVNDNQFEADETINASLSNPSGGVSLGAQSTAIIRILNDDRPQPGTVSFSRDTYQVSEAGVASLTLVRTGGTDGEISVNLSSLDGSATAGQDYDNRTLHIRFADGQATQALSFPIYNDNLQEGNETIRLLLSEPSGGANIGAINRAVLTIEDDDKPNVSLTLAPNAVGEDTGGQLIYTIYRDRFIQTPLSLNFTISGSAQLGSDYTLSGAKTLNGLAGSIEIAANSETATLVITPSKDSIFEADETLELRLQPNSDSILLTQQPVVGTILNDDQQTTLSLLSKEVRFAEHDRSNQQVSIQRTGNSS
ncbi:MAG: Calx-beta domain-containing protein, partial [Synechococcaceae cyanobacterium]